MYKITVSENIVQPQQLGDGWTKQDREYVSADGSLTLAPYTSTFNGKIVPVPDDHIVELVADSSDHAVAELTAAIDKFNAVADIIDSVTQLPRRNDMQYHNVTWRNGLDLAPVFNEWTKKWMLVLHGKTTRRHIALDASTPSIARTIIELSENLV